LISVRKGEGRRYAVRSVKERPHLAGEFTEKGEFDRHPRASGKEASGYRSNSPSIYFEIVFHPGLGPTIRQSGLILLILSFCSQDRYFLPDCIKINNYAVNFYHSIHDKNRAFRDNPPNYIETKPYILKAECYGIYA